VGGFQVLDPQGNGWERHFMDGSPVVERNIRENARHYIGYAKMIPCLYLTHFVRHDVAVLDLVALPNGGTSLRVQQDSSRRFMTVSDVERGEVPATQLVLTLDALGRVTETYWTQNDQKWHEQYVYADSGAHPWFVPTRAVIGNHSWDLMESNSITEDQAPETLSKSGVMIKIAHVTAHLKQEEIDSQGGHNTVNSSAEESAQRGHARPRSSRWALLSLSAVGIGCAGILLYLFRRQFRRA
jgi:hypothetical protein